MRLHLLLSFAVLVAALAFCQPIKQDLAPSAWNAIPQPGQLQINGNKLWQPNNKTRILLPDGDDELQSLALHVGQQLASAAGLSQSPTVEVQRQAERGDIVLKRQQKSKTNEAFMVEVDKTITITASDKAGFLYGGQQVIQNIVATGSVPFATVSSAPAVGERGLHLDIGRKRYSKEWILQLLQDMAYIGLNTLQLHFSENEGFGIECKTYPAVASEGALSHDNVKEIIAAAKSLEIRVVPSLDMPGHLQKALSSGFEDLQLKDASGAAVKGALDIAKPEALVFAKALIEEYTTLFQAQDSVFWNLGADEFVDFEQMENYPSLNDEAQNKFGQGATGFDLLTDFANSIGRYLSERGYIARVWNDGMFRSEHVELSKTTEITWWTNWSPEMANLTTALKAGNNLVNFNDALMYYVLGENAGYTYPTAPKFWDKDWRPGVFPTTKFGNQTIDQPYPDILLGAYFAIWSDKADAQTEAQVAQGIRAPLRAMAERSWNDGSRFSIAQFESVNEAIKSAP